MGDMGLKRVKLWIPYTYELGFERSPCYLLPGRPLRALYVNLGLVVPVVFKAKLSWTSPRFRNIIREILDSTTIKYTLGFPAGIRRRIIKRKTTIPPKYAYNPYAPKILPKAKPYKIDYTYYDIVVAGFPIFYKVTPRRIYYKLREIAVPLDKPLPLVKLHDKLLDYDGAYYVSKNKIANLKYYTGYEHANYVVYNKNYIVLLS